jgi:hypothetical protein
VIEAGIGGSGGVTIIGGISGALKSIFGAGAGGNSICEIAGAASVAGVDSVGVEIIGAGAGFGSGAGAGETCAATSAGMVGAAGAGFINAAGVASGLNCIAGIDAVS